MNKSRHKFKLSLDFYRLSLVSNVLIVSGLLILFLFSSGVIWSELVYRFNEWRGITYALDDSVLINSSNTLSTEKITAPEKKIPFFRGQEIKIKPVNIDFSIVIERLNVNAPIVKDVSVINEKDYMSALREGVAHASFSDYPDNQNAQVYLFAHSAINFWQLGPYANVFNQIHKLTEGDTINVFYEGKRYLYRVDSLVFKDNFSIDDTVYNNIGPVLILQTCYPPGTTNYRLIVTSSLLKVFE